MDDEGTRTADATGTEAKRRAETADDEEIEAKGAEEGEIKTNETDKERKDATRRLRRAGEAFDTDGIDP